MGKKHEVLALRDECVLDKVPADESQHVLAQDWGGLTPMFPVASGGLAPTMIPDLYAIFGKRCYYAVRRRNSRAPYGHSSRSHCLQAGT